MGKRELSTVLAALRSWQVNNMPEGSEVCRLMLAIGRGAASTHGPTEVEIACDGGTITPLDQAEIDALCERLNCEVEPETMDDATIRRVQGE